MQGLLYEESTLWPFVVITLLMGGWTAWRTGRAVAGGWGAYPTLIVYLLILTFAVRFIHHALSGGTMFSPHYYVADAIVLLAIGILGYRRTRTRQMVTQYSWLYEPAGPLNWRPRPQAPEPAAESR